VPISLLDLYAGKVTAGHIERDANQEDVLRRLEELRVTLEGDPTRTRAFLAGSRALIAKGRRFAASTFEATLGAARQCSGPRRAQISRAFSWFLGWCPRLHPCLAPTTAQWFGQGRRPCRGGGGCHRPKILASVFRRVQRHRHRRRDDSWPAFRGFICPRHGDRRDIQCASGSPLSGWSQSRALPAVHCYARRADANYSPHRLPAAKAAGRRGLFRAPGRKRGGARRRSPACFS
jgi:hypothetical protein